MITLLVTTAVAGSSFLYADARVARAFQVSRESLESIEAVRRAIASAVATGYDTVLVPLSLQPGAETNRFDGGAQAIREAKLRALRVYASIDVGRAAGFDELPGSREHVVYQHPEWLMVPRDLAVEMLRVDSRSPEYLGRLARWTRANVARADALYISPLHPEAVNYLVERVTNVLGRYEVDGVHLEALRFPGMEFDYSRRALAAFRAEMYGRLSSAERLRMNEVDALDPFAYPEEFPDEWRHFRQTRLTSLVVRLGAAIRAVHPAAHLSASVTADEALALQTHLQDWRTWIDNRLVDTLIHLPDRAITALQRPSAAGSH